MPQDLFIFVDESGRHSAGEYYTVAGCWCISNNEPRHILDNARADIASHICDVCGFDEIGELKGTKLPNDKLGTFLDTFRDFVYNDGTVAAPPYPWSQAHPLRCTYHECNPELGKRILSDYMTEADAPEALQKLALSVVLRPLTHAEDLDLDRIREIHLIPDAEVWDAPANRICELIDDTVGREINVETRNSSRTPGIQISDLMAYSRRSYIKDNSCKRAASLLKELSL
jgi:hypothetical protein